MAAATTTTATTSPPTQPLLAPPAEKGAAPTAPTPIIGVKTPKNTLLYVIKAGMAKGDMPWQTIAILGFMSGLFVGFGGLLSSVVAGGISTSSPGLIKLAVGATFPVALFLIVFTGGELFTGNCMYMTAAMLGGKTTWRKFAKSWFVSYFANFAGCVCFAYFFTYLAGILDSDPWLSYIITVGSKKTHLGWGVVVLRGICANWLVCLALWLTISSDSFEGKIFGMWWPIMTFATIGYEHSIANMYFVPTGLMYSNSNPTLGDYTFGDFIGKNLIPATIGNMIGGGVFVACVYFYVYREHAEKAIEALTLKQGKHRHHLLPHFVSARACLWRDSNDTDGSSRTERRFLRSRALFFFLF